MVTHTNMSCTNRTIKGHFTHETETLATPGGPAGPLLAQPVPPPRANVGRPSNKDGTSSHPVGWMYGGSYAFKRPVLDGSSWHSECLQPLIYPILSCVRTRMNENSLEKHLVEGLITYGFKLHLRILDHMTWFWRCDGTAFGHFHLGSHNFMVVALGSCVKWPLVCLVWMDY